jgi:hypothetical protein
MDGQAGFDALLHMLSVIRGEDIRYPMSATVEETDETGRRSFSRVRVSDRAHSWRVEEDDQTISYSPKEGLVFHRGEAAGDLRHQRSDWMPPSVQAFYPLKMRIWGGYADDLRISGAERLGGGVLLSLVYREDEEYTATALFDDEYGVVTEFREPARSLILRDLRTDIPGPEKDA